MVGLARVAHGGRGHGDLEAAQHVIKTPDPCKALGRRLVHGEVEGDAQKHLLRALERRVVVAMNDVSANEQVETRIGEQLVARGIHVGRGLVELRARIGRQDVGAVQPLVGQVMDELRERLNAERRARCGKVAGEREVAQPGRDELPSRSLLAGQLDRRADERLEPRGLVLPLPRERAEPGGQHRQIVRLLGKIALDARQNVINSIDRHVAGELQAGGALLRTMVTIQDVVLGDLKVPALHEGALHQVLNVLDALDCRGRHGALDHLEQGEELVFLVGSGALGVGLGALAGQLAVRARRRIGTLVVRGGLRARTLPAGIAVHVGECAAHRLDDLARLVRLRPAVALPDNARSGALQN